MIGALHCRCGQQILEAHLLHQEYYLRPFGPHLVYVKYRCPRCSKLTEQFIRQEDWSETALLPETSNEHRTQDHQEFDRLGPITSREAADTRYELERGNPLKSLNEYLGSEKE